jgi:hypothetical protein
MKKIYEKAEMKVLVFLEEDVIKTSQNDNLEPMPDFPEGMV